MMAVIYYAYGAPRSVDDLEAYFQHVMKGKPVPEPMLKQIMDCFRRPGFPDFIRSTAERTAKGLEWLLNRELAEPVRVFPAYKHTPPSVEEAYEAVLRAGADTVVTLSVNPIHSPIGGGAVHAEVAALNRGKPVRHIPIERYHLDPGFVQAYADRVRRAYDWLPREARSSAYVLFTVHSLPKAGGRTDDYVGQFQEMAAAVGAAAGVPRYRAVFRSGRSDGWLGPDVKEAMRALAAEGAKGFVTCDLMSVTADVESYREINGECRAVARELQVELAVAEFLGDSFDAVVAAAQLIKSRL